MNRRKSKQPHQERSRNGVREKQRQQEEKHAVEHGRETEKKPEQARKKPDEDSYACPPAPLMLFFHGPSVARHRESTKKF